MTTKRVKARKRGSPSRLKVYGSWVEHIVEFDDGTILAVVPDPDFDWDNPMYDEEVKKDLRQAVEDGDVWGVVHYDPNADEFEELGATWGMAGYGSPEAAAEAYIRDYMEDASDPPPAPTSTKRSEGDKLFEFFFGKKRGSMDGLRGLRDLGDDSFEEHFRTRDGAHVTVLVWRDQLARNKQTAAYLLTIDKPRREPKMIQGRVTGDLYTGVQAARRRLVRELAGADEEG